VASVFAQTRQISGIVTDQKGTPSPSASITIKGAKIGTSTAEDGTFKLSVGESAKVLQVKSINFIDQEITLGSKLSFVIKLETATQNLEEVVVVGYGTQRKSNVTASIAKIDASKIENKPFASIDQMLQGAAPGLQATSSTGQPGAVTPIRIRGIGSFSYAGARPLYIVDGAQINDGDVSNGNGGGFSINPSTNVLATINSDDIESINILKDAAATSIYGSRGANGVVVITTKSGKVGKTQFRFDTEMGTNTPILPPAMGMPLRTDDWMSLYKEGLINGGATAASAQTTLNSYGYGNGVDVDWFGLITRKGMQNQYNMSVSGGDAKTKFFASAGYFKQEGTTIATDFTRITGNIKVTHQATDKLSFTTKVSAGSSVQNSALASSGPSGGGGYFGNPSYVSMVLRPTQNPYRADGSLNIAGDNLGFPAHYNPLYVAANDKRWLKGINAIANENIEYKIMRGLKFSSTINMQYTLNEEYQFNNPFHGDGSGSNGEAISIITRAFLYDFINQLDYHWDINPSKKFTADFKAGQEAIKSQNMTQIGDVTGFPPRTDLYYSTNGATSTNGKVGASDYTFSGYFSNATFSLLDKYTLYGSFRRDGSSRFGINNPYGNFWSVGASWNILNESFLKKATFLSALKLHGSYGTNGNAEIGNYTWRPSYAYGANYNGIAGGTFNNIGNESLTWEKNKQIDLGLNVSFLQNRITLNADVYKRTTDGSLLNQNISRTTGFTGYINNVGSLENKGLELSLNVVPVKLKDFTWEINASFTANNNKVTSLPSGDQTNGSYLLRVGQPFYSFYTRGWAGVDPATGTAQYYTDSTKTTITTNKTAAALFLVGKQADPKYYGSIGNTISYKGFSLNFDFYYNYGNYFQEAYAQYFLDGTYGSRGKYTYNLQRWQNPGDITNVPKYVAASSQVSSSGSDRLLYSGDYIRLRNVQISYRYDDKKVLSKLHVSSINIYARGTNLWTKTYDANLLSDPEQGITGVNNQQVLPSKSITFGLSINF
jgi:TonB-linked SusC/RagA family outer membrane protein